MLREQVLYSLRDISIIPAVSTNILSRSECNPFRRNIEKTDMFYPLIASPMDSVVNENNFFEYQANKINCIIPRSIPENMIKEYKDQAYDKWLERRLELCREVFCAFSLKEVKECFINKDFNSDKQFYVLIDMANGSMLDAIRTGEKFKDKYLDNAYLMGGNIGNPMSYLLYDKAGFDYLRIGVGSGNGCLTSTNTGVHYPYASLISDISEMKRRYHSNCKIIADGGMSGYSDIIKSLALGADYVMCGRIFAQAAKRGEIVGSDVIYRGMSTKDAQKAMGNAILKTAEGRCELIKKEYTLYGWVENFDSYLRSAMSYCDSRDLSEFREKSICQVISPNSSSQINDK